MNKPFSDPKKLLSISTLVIAIDQLSKNWANQNLDFLSSKSFLPGIIQLRLTYNTGAAFNLLSNSSSFLSIISLIVSIGLILYIVNNELDYWQGLGLALLLGGCIGNGLDRWRLGHVIDFLELTQIKFPIFNIADMAINLAVMCLCFNSLKGKNSNNDK